MLKLPFTPQGVQDLLSQIYALPDIQLQNESAAAAANFRLWISSNFLLEASQQIYLEAIDDQFIASAATEVSYFIQNRYPIELIKEEVTAALTEQQEGDRGKLIDLGKATNKSFNTEEGFREENRLTFTISYANV